MDLGVIEQLCDNIEKYNDKSSVGRVFFSLHGGEPLAVGKRYFQQICDTIKKSLSVPYKLLLQSNAVLIDEEWINIFKRYNIGLGISMDGSQEYHDLHRRFQNGEGSFHIVDKNIRLCIKNNLDIGVLMVADPIFSAEKIFNYLIDDLKIKNMDILLRDYTHDTLMSKKYVHELMKYLLEWMNLWFNRNDKSIRIRLFDSIIKTLIGKSPEMEAAFAKSANNIPTITVYTNGDVSPADDLLSAENSIINIGKNINTNDLSDIFSHDVFKKINDEILSVPRDCYGCKWKNVCCGGGGMLERFSISNGFKNKGIYCKIWKKLFSEIYNRLIKSGYDANKLSQTLSGD